MKSIKSTSLNCAIYVTSLKRNKKISNTRKVAKLFINEIKSYENVNIKLFYMRDYYISPGVEFDTGEKNDQFKPFYKTLNWADVVVLCTPVWWGLQSSVCQAFMERVGAYDDVAIKTGFTPLYNKVFGCIITASNDGFQHVHGVLNCFAANMGMTCPPENHVYWGTILQTTKKKEDPSSNEETLNQIKNCARNLYLWGKTIKTLDLGNLAQKIKPGKVGILSDDSFKKSKI